MKSHEELEVWHKAVELSVEVYRVTNVFPEEEKSGLTHHLRQASIAIASNIAVGVTRQNQQDLIEHLSTAAGSASELNTQLVISRRLGFSSEKALRSIEMETRVICRMLQGLVKSASRG